MVVAFPRFQFNPVMKGSMMKLFNKKLNADSFTNLIAEGTSIEGRVNFSGTIKIQGLVKGDIFGASLDQKNNDCLIVDKTGEVTSDMVKIGDAIIAGTISCKELRVEGTLRALSSAKISGATIYYRTLEIEPGALITGCQLYHIEHVDKAVNQTEL